MSEETIRRMAGELVAAADGDRDELEYLLAELRMAVEITVEERSALSSAKKTA